MASSCPLIAVLIIIQKLCKWYASTVIPLMLVFFCFRQRACRINHIANIGQNVCLIRPLKGRIFFLDFLL